ncbi:acyltransferase [Aeromicrobium panaciterrae]|uniref:acyltransferase family protein n=1 Tax=Aeromicrobium panaciterrae TaxID=363861 RepID=UPI0031E13E3E
MTTPTRERVAHLSTTFPALTGLRAVASVAVVVTHVAYWTGRYQTDTIGLFWARLDSGVALFFALSGFLLFRPWISRLVDEAPYPATGRYAWNRILRIIPAYWIVVAFGLALVDSQTGNGVSGIVRHLTLTQIYGSGHLHGGLTQTWSLATEIAFYALLPLLGWFVVCVVCRRTWRPARILVFLSAMCLLNFAYYVLAYHLDGISPSSLMWLPGFLSWFAVGMALTVIVAMARTNDGWARRLLAIAADSPVACWIAALALLALASTPMAGVPSLYQESAGTAITRNVLYAGMAFLMMIPLVTDRPNLMQRALSWSPMQWLGTISYELFLVHVMLLELAMHLLGFETFTGSMLLGFIVTMAISVPAAWALYRVLDAPLRHFHR